MHFADTSKWRQQYESVRTEKRCLQYRPDPNTGMTKESGHGCLLSKLLFAEIVTAGAGA